MPLYFYYGIADDGNWFPLLLPYGLLAILNDDAAIVFIGDHPVQTIG